MRDSISLILSWSISSNFGEHPL